MDLHCISGLPSCSSTKVRSRDCPHAIGDHVHRRLEVQLLPRRPYGGRYLTVREPVGVRQQLVARRAFRTEMPRRDRRGWIAFNRDELAVSRWNTSCPQPTAQYGHTERATAAPHSWLEPARVVRSSLLRRCRCPTRRELPQQRPTGSQSAAVVLMMWPHARVAHARVGLRHAAGRERSRARPLRRPRRSAAARSRRASRPRSHRSPDRSGRSSGADGR